MTYGQPCPVSPRPAAGGPSLRIASCHSGAAQWVPRWGGWVPQWVRTLAAHSSRTSYHQSQSLLPPCRLQINKESLSVCIIILLDFHGLFFLFFSLCMHTRRIFCFLMRRNCCNCNLAWYERPHAAGAPYPRYSPDQGINKPSAHLNGPHQQLTSLCGAQVIVWSNIMSCY